MASKDCRVCNRRRIKCDRTLPTCGKCAKRGLICSGYGVILKWDQGVASRGNLKGNPLPVKHVQSAPSILEVVEKPESPDNQIRQSNDQFHGITTSSALETSNIPNSLTTLQLLNDHEQRLLHHYDHIVAPNMAWANSPGNPWRHIIIPLALESPPLLNAILAFAAKHINAVSISSSNRSTSLIPVSKPDTFRQRAMKLLAREIQELVARESSPNSFTGNEKVLGNRSNAILATMLVLCNVETVWPDSPVWQVHLNAAQTVITSHHNPTPIKRREDATAIFLEQELFIANTFASTTNFLNFTPSNDINLRNETSKPSSLFIEFLKLLQMVTNLERQASGNLTRFSMSGISPSGLRVLFENARSRTLELGKTFHVSDADDYLHLSRTVNCFYHAGLIYSYRALLKAESLDNNFSSEIETARVDLFRALGFAKSSKPTFAQDLVWPLFIAGTEATNNDDQEMVIAKLEQAMSETGFSNCQHALQFLKALWERRAGDELLEREFDWITFAREWTRQGRTFLVF